MEHPIPAEQRPGRLKIFFGYAPGSGKTRAMLKAAFTAQKAANDVVVGCLAASHRADLQSLGGQFPLLPPAPATGEFDLDAALALRPRLILLDDLAHTNAPGSRHLKRWQDVQELLRAGLDVYTTLNVQHLESLTDQITDLLGKPEPSRVPDPFFDAADAVLLVDAEPAELVHTSQAPLPLPTLTALRGLALRRMAERGDHTLNSNEPARVNAGGELLICLSAAPSNARVIRTAARMAEAFHGGFTALFVESPNYDRIGEEERRALRENLQLAEELGARIATMYGDDPAIQIAEYARLSGISKIVLGRSPQRRGVLGSGPGLMDRLSALAPDMDIYIIPDLPDRGEHHAPHGLRLPMASVFSPGMILRTIGILSLCTLIGYAFVGLGFTTANIIMVYILGVLCITMVTEGRSYSLLSSVLAVLVFNFCFTQPYFTLISSPRDIATFGVMFLVALLSSSLTVRIKQQAAQSAQKAYRTEILLETSRKLQKADSVPAIYTAAATQLKKLLARDLLLYPVAEDGALQEPLLYPSQHGDPLTGCLSATERDIARWVYVNNKHAGATTRTLQNAQCLYTAVRGTGRVYAVAGVRIDADDAPDTFEKNLMVAILDECGLALEKEYMVRAKQRSEETARQEALRANLLRAISHDLRTPLTSISGNAGILMENGGALDESKRQSLYLSIYDDTMWLINLVENLLSITRIENGAMKLNLQPELLEDVFNEALLHLDRNAAAHQIDTVLEGDLLMASIDARLIVQVVINLVNNAIKYTPPGSHIRLVARRCGPNIEVCVQDDGPGIAPAVQERLFEMFFTADCAGADSRRGLGLGLALCRSIVNAHGGTITEQNVEPHGACFRFTLPAQEVDLHE